jgi:hypothetical protein
MPEPEFPKYGLKMSKGASDDQELIAPDVYPAVRDILREITIDPMRHRERLSPASRDGSSFVYTHPEPHVQITFEVAEDEGNIYVFSIAALEFKPKKSIFVSYSHEDAEWLERVKKFLTVLEQQGIIEFWDDTKIEPAADWKAEIKKALDSSKAALLLVSQDFLISDFVGKYELPRLLEQAEREGKKIYWIPVRPSTVNETHKEIARFQSLLKNPSKSLADLSPSEREHALVQVSKKLSELH